MPIIQRWFTPLLLLGILLNATGLFSDILETDGTLYADVAKHIITHHDWVNLFAYGGDWLDKPHFPFWATALSFKIFGLTSFAYKLPGFLFWLAGVRYIYMLTVRLYDQPTAKLSVLVYMIALHAVIGNFDVRAEPFLTTLTIGAIYYMYRIMFDYHWHYVVLAALFCACAIMTKGVFILITIAAGFVIFWMIQKDWKQFIRPKWWILLALILVFTLPELWCLYQQFDLHPEKTMFNTTHVSGIKFFFWDSQFGRFFNTGPIKGSGDLTFFLHTTLWAFLPWSILLYVAVFTGIFKKRENRQPKIWIIYGSALVTFLIFSVSKFQLPYYITILFPHFSIMVAAYLLTVQKPAAQKAIGTVQAVILVIAVFFATLLSIIANLPNAMLVIACASAIGLWALLSKSNSFLESVLKRSYGYAAILYLFMNVVFYPTILYYQSSVQAARVVNNKYAAYPVGMTVNNSGFEFYTNSAVIRLFSADSISQYAGQSPLVVYTDEAGLKNITLQHPSVQVLQRFQDFHISMLTGDFINAKTRSMATHNMYLIKVSR